VSPVHRIGDAALRFDDWGPGYLVQDDVAHFGVVVLRPGDEFGNHLHEHHTESFLVLAGTAELWLDRNERIPLVEGDFVPARPGVEHYLRNISDASFTAFFVKAPGVSGDKIERPWRPAEHGRA
jgi:quercetin dioxygenase-like cupin family protein